ncbi:IS30 family transposase [Eubacterium limosum]|uniref:IS30 family transposase n=1 Tax=Eubacterium limosum TaxID=1736 RepID=UPI0022E3BFAB|nr:IS30 family transposase [Eubacterium limosum]
MFKHLDIDERKFIEAYTKAGFTQRSIAGMLGKSERTIRRELSRCEKGHYSSKEAHEQYKDRQHHKGRKIKVSYDENLKKYIEKYILHGWSPDAIAGTLKLKKPFSIQICTATIYNLLDKNYFKNVSNANLLIKSKRIIKRRKPAPEKREKYKPERYRSIEERPDIVNARITPFNWEMDCIESKRDDNTALLVMTERLTRFSFIRKIKSKSPEAVKQALDELQIKFGRLFPFIFNTITVDCGSEFLKDQLIEFDSQGKRRTTLYFCHPGSPWERGSNENYNRFVRRYVNKKYRISHLPETQLQNIQELINEFPRKILGYRSSKELLMEYLSAIFI